MVDLKDYDWLKPWIGSLRNFNRFLSDAAFGLLFIGTAHIAEYLAGSMETNNVKCPKSPTFPPTFADVVHYTDLLMVSIIILMSAFRLIIRMAKDEN